eukprot:5478420-Amphidinium_carterae.1
MALIVIIAWLTLRVASLTQFTRQQWFLNVGTALGPGGHETWVRPRLHWMQGQMACAWARPPTFKLDCQPPPSSTTLPPSPGLHLLRNER